MTQTTSAPAAAAAPSFAKVAASGGGGGFSNKSISQSGAFKDRTKPEAVRDSNIVAAKAVAQKFWRSRPAKI